MSKEFEIWIWMMCLSAKGDCLRTGPKVHCLLCPECVSICVSRLWPKRCVSSEPMIFSRSLCVTPLCLSILLCRTVCMCDMSRIHSRNISSRKHQSANAFGWDFREKNGSCHGINRSSVDPGFYRRWCTCCGWDRSCQHLDERIHSSLTFWLKGQMKCAPEVL